MEQKNDRIPSAVQPICKLKVAQLTAHQMLKVVDYNLFPALHQEMNHTGGLSQAWDTLHTEAEVKDMSSLALTPCGPLSITYGPANVSYVHISIWTAKGEGAAPMAYLLPCSPLESQLNITAWG